MAVALAHNGSFGFAIQTEKGSFLTPDTWLPVIDDQETVQLQRNLMTLDMADTMAYETKYLSAGEWVEGQIMVPLVPGSLTNLFSWMQDRDSDNQGKWASVLLDCVNETKKIRDAKIRKATVDFVKGRPVTCALDIVARHIESGSAATPNMPTAAPYVYQEASVELATGGGALASDINCEAIRLEIDNMLEDGADGMRLNSSIEPGELYNTAGRRARGAFSRDFVDSAVYSDFLDGQEGALSIELTRGANVATITLPRILYTESDLGLPGSHEKRIVETVQFAALGSSDGITPPVTLA
ncbi:MAG: hypothetical protein R6V19_15605 [Armatimonadota bacterium]